MTVIGRAGHRGASVYIRRIAASSPAAYTLERVAREHLRHLQ
jgi:hypothetical protein